MVPLHLWLPDAYTHAPSSVNTLLAPVMTKVGAYAMIRMFLSVFPDGYLTDVVPVADALIVLGLAGVVYGGAAAIGQQDIRRMLAYSSISQIGLIAAAIGLASPLGFIAALLHIMNHAVMKAALFIAAASVRYRTGESSVDGFTRLGRTMPLTMGAFTVAGVSMIGIPPTAGFFSKWWVAQAGTQAGTGTEQWAVVAVVLGSSMLTAAYLFRVLERAYLRPAQRESAAASVHTGAEGDGGSQTEPSNEAAAGGGEGAAGNGAAGGGPSSGNGRTRSAQHAHRDASPGARPLMGGTLSSPLPLIAVLIPAVGALLVALSGERHRNLRDAWSTLAALALVGVVASMLPNVLDGTAPETTLIELSPGIDVTLRADPAGMIFALLASSLWVLAGVYGVGYMRAGGEHKQTRFFSVFALSLGATMGVAFAGNLLTFVLFYELLTLFTYPLVIHRETEESIAAGRKYLAYTLSGGVLLIGATAWVQVLEIDASFTAGGFLAGRVTSDATLWGLLALLGLGRWREGGGHAAAQLAARGDGRADARFGAAARGGRREGGRIRRRAHARVRVRRRRIARDGRVAGHRGVRRRDGDHGVGARVAAGQSQAAARVLDRDPPLLHRARRCAAGLHCAHRSAAPHRGPRRNEDHAVLLRRRHTRADAPRERERG